MGQKESQLTKFYFVSFSRFSLYTKCDQLSSAAAVALMFIALSGFTQFTNYISILSHATEQSLPLKITSLLPLLSCLSYIFLYLWVKLSLTHLGNTAAVLLGNCSQTVCVLADMCWADSNIAFEIICHLKKNTVLCTRSHYSHYKKNHYSCPIQALSIAL